MRAASSCTPGSILFARLLPPTASASARFVTRLHPEWIRRYGNLLLLDPGEPAARAYVQSVILDVLRRYDVDGIHIDDYFYPYPVKDKSGAILPFPDDPTWRRYESGGGRLDRGDWRRDNINQFVEGTYRAIKAEKHWVKFGISPFGIWRPRVPESIEAKLDAYGQLYADSRRWLQEGWCDYLSPQLYWPIDLPAQSFPVLYDWWVRQNRAGHHLWPGLASERIGPQRSAQEIARELAITRGEAKDPGQLFWDMKSLMRDVGGIDAILRDGAYHEPALVPASPWLGADPPSAPRLNVESNRVSWKTTGDIPARWWAVQMKTGAEWKYQLLPAGRDSVILVEGTKVAAVRAIDRFGNASPAAEISVK